MRSVGSVLERAARAVMRYPRVCYAVRGVQMRVRPPRHDLPPLRKDADRYTPLFATSGRTFELLLRPWVAEFDWSVGRTNNGTFESIDAELYHAVLRTYRPKRVIEIGGGHSSRFAREALRRNGHGEIAVIDPSPRMRLPRGVEHRCERIEDAEPSVVDGLVAGDVLFIDSSHTTEEARLHVGELLPRLASGVIVQHHDVLFPFDRYYQDDAAAFGEQDVLLDFYLANTDAFEVLTGAAWVAYAHPDLIDELVASSRWQPGRVPGSLWTRKR